MTTKGTDNRFRSLTVVGESGTPATPASGDFKLYVADDGTFYLMDDTGTPTAVGGGGFSDPMTTRGDIIVRNASNVTARLAIGSAGKVLSSDGTDVSWQTPASGGALVLLEQHTASSSASLDFTSFISATYDHYVFSFVDVLPATDNVSFVWQAGTGGGPTYDTGANYTHTDGFSYVNTGGGEGASGATSAAISGSLKNATLGVCGIGYLFNPQGTSRGKGMVGHTVNVHTSVGFIQRSWGGFYTPTTALTAVRFLMSSGNIASGTIRAYGVAK